MVQTSDEAEQWELAIDRFLLDPLKKILEKAVQVNVDRMAHLLTTLSKVEEDMAQDSGDFVAASSLITEVPVTVPTWHMIGGSASELYEAEGSDRPFQSARLLPGLEEVAAGKGGGGSNGW
jgi:hypothetical protein